MYIECAQESVSLTNHFSQTLLSGCAHMCPSARSSPSIVKSYQAISQIPSNINTNEQCTSNIVKLETTTVLIAKGHVWPMRYTRKAIHYKHENRQ